MKFFLIFIFVVNYLYVPGQTYNDIDQREYMKLINKQLSFDDRKLINNLNELDENASDLMLETDGLYEKLQEINSQIENEKDKRKKKKLFKKSEKIEESAIGNRINALSQLNEISLKKYIVYYKDLKKYYSSSNNEKLDTVKKIEKIVNEYFEKADFKLQTAFHSVSIDKGFMLSTEAYRLEQLGLLNIMKMYSVFLDFDNSLKLEIENEIKQIIIKSINDDKEIVSEIKDSVNIQTVLVYDTVKVVEKELSNKIIYKIQIAASKTPLTINKLRLIYDSKDVISAEYSDGWYKYLIGFFDTYEKASKFKLIIGVSDSFIVGYKNGYRISTKDLIKELENINNGNKKTD